LGPFNFARSMARHTEADFAAYVDGAPAATTMTASKVETFT
jgi:hypothetical protein